MMDRGAGGHGDRPAAPPPPLTDEQVRRYARHVLLPDIGGVGQARLLGAEVVVDLGPAGGDRQSGARAAALAYLAAAGVGHIVLGGAAVAAPLGAGEVASGILFGAGDLGRARDQAVADRIAALNPDVTVVRGRAAGPGALRLADELDPAPGDLDPALAVADALARGGAAAARILVRIARPGGGAA